MLSQRTLVLTVSQALKAQLDRVVSSQPMKRQETAADAEVTPLQQRLFVMSVVEPSTDERD